jgi:hypothetical protein
MANCAIAWPNWLAADPSYATVAVSGGGWDPDAPLSRLLNPSLSGSAVARTVDVSSGSTQFWTDLGQARRLKVFAFPWIRGITSTGLISGYVQLTVRVRVFTAQSTESTLIYDSGVIEQHPVIYDRDTLPSSHPSFLTGKILPEDAAVFAWKQPWWHWADSEILGRYVLTEINAAGSSLETLEIPYYLIAPGYQPTINMLNGASINLEPLTQVSTSQSGKEFFDVRPIRRVARFTLNEDENEGLTQILDMMTRQGVSLPVFSIWNTDDTVHKQRRAFLGRLRQLSSLEFPTFERTQAALEISEVLE